MGTPKVPFSLACLCVWTLSSLSWNRAGVLAVNPLTVPGRLLSLACFLHREPGAAVIVGSPWSGGSCTLAPLLHPAPCTVRVSLPAQLGGILVEWRDVIASPPFYFIYFGILGSQWIALILGDIWIWGDLSGLEISVHWGHHSG